LINAVELEALLDSLSHLQELRVRLGLMGARDDVVPENPAKLDRLAQAYGYEDGNAFLSRHESVIGTVRRIYEEGLERLKAR